MFKASVVFPVKFNGAQGQSWGKALSALEWREDSGILWGWKEHTSEQMPMETGGGGGESKEPGPLEGGVERVHCP